MVTFEINYQSSIDGSEAPVNLVDPGEILNPSEIVYNGKIEYVELTYPLTSKFKVPVPGNNTMWERWQIYQIIYAAYCMANAYPYMWWGHYISDLFIEGVTIDKEVVTLVMGS